MDSLLEQSCDWLARVCCCTCSEPISVFYSAMIGHEQIKDEQIKDAQIGITRCLYGLTILPKRPRTFFLPTCTWQVNTKIGFLSLR